MNRDLCPLVTSNISRSTVLGDALSAVPGLCSGVQISLVSVSGRLSVELRVNEKPDSTAQTKHDQNAEVLHRVATRGHLTRAGADGGTELPSELSRLAGSFPSGHRLGLGSLRRSCGGLCEGCGLCQALDLVVKVANTAGLLTRLTKSLGGPVGELALVGSIGGSLSSGTLGSSGGGAGSSLGLSSLLRVLGLQLLRSLFLADDAVGILLGGGSRGLGSRLGLLLPVGHRERSSSLASRLFRGLTHLGRGGGRMGSRFEVIRRLSSGAHTQRQKHHQCQDYSLHEERLSGKT
mmetsp:Transcript_74130/g.174060  ORF Transcript_74130/g.174060 Transcript_74130/m.174060 type:complete len:292 (-) Transcript_74130:42-917(-)